MIYPQGIGVYDFLLSDELQSELYKKCPGSSNFLMVVNVV